MSQQPSFDISSLDQYKSFCIDQANQRLGRFGSLEEIAAAESSLNIYPNLDRLTEPRDVHVLDETELEEKDFERARKAVLEGRLFCEHTAAGEATRLKLGTKYTIDPAKDLSAEKIRQMLQDELGRDVTVAEVEGDLEISPDRLLPLSLGLRHMLQISFDIHNLAIKAGVDPKAALARQKMLLILNEKTVDEILKGALKANFFGFNRENVLFMVQQPFPGINLKEGKFFFDDSLPPRLHNHGQLVMQETMDDQIFHLEDNGSRKYLKAREFQAILADMSDKISYNIEDLGYLTSAIDWPSLALALKLSNQGFNMVMEIVANNPDRPQKGGLAAFDNVLNRNVMVESFQLKGMANSDIKYLNKNFNHFPNPEECWLKLKTNGLPMPIVIKNNALYFQPVQGDISSLVDTAFVQRRILKPIHSWKSAATTPPTINAMGRQDNQPDFKAYIEKILA